jgi:ParB family chromosome partitioning protein
MRADRHFVDELANHSTTAVGFLLPLDRIETNPDQPRTNLGDLTELAASIRAKGVLEPLLVRKLQNSRSYQLVAGERRFHAAIEAGLLEVPCIEITADDREAMEVALIENLQRRDLSPFEEAEGYRTLAEKYGHTHEEISGAIGKSRSTISETLRLLAMPPAIRDLCRHADITAKSMLLVIAKADSVEEMERLIQELAEGNLDREALRHAARRTDATNGEAARKPSTDDSHPDASQRFRPRTIRFRVAADAPVHFSFSIRRPDVSREEVIATLEELLQRLRKGDLDETLQPFAPGAEESQT